MRPIAQREVQERRGVWRAGVVWWCAGQWYERQSEIEDESAGLDLAADDQGNLYAGGCVDCRRKLTEGEVLVRSGHSVRTLEGSEEGGRCVVRLWVIDGRTG